VTVPAKLPPLYPIVDARGTSEDAGRRAEELAVTLAAAGAEIVQLRAKSLDAGPLTALAARLVHALGRHRCRLIVNDRVDVAAAAGAAGVHLGDSDLPVSAARELLGSDALIGFSTHAVDEVASPNAQAADYLGFGPVFESPTKAGVRTPRGIEALEEACRATKLPVVAIGGITLDTAAAVWSAGAAAAAVISEIERSESPHDLLLAYRAAHRAAHGERSAG
jgi:thiamine-phosphate pyrophosphorylase